MSSIIVTYIPVSSSLQAVNQSVYSSIASVTLTDGTAVSLGGHGEVTGCTIGEPLTLCLTTSTGGTNIVGYMFSECTEVSMVEFPSDSPVTSIDSYAFLGCTNLHSIWFNQATCPSLRPSAFQGCEDVVYYYPSGSDYSVVESAITETRGVGVASASTAPLGFRTNPVYVTDDGGICGEYIIRSTAVTLSSISASTNDNWLSVVDTNQSAGTIYLLCDGHTGTASRQGSVVVSYKMVGDTQVTPARTTYFNVVQAGTDGFPSGTISVDKDNITFSNIGDSDTVTVTLNGVTVPAGGVSSDSAWLPVNYNASYHIISVSANPNNSEEGRGGTITIVGTDNTTHEAIYKYVSVYQYGTSEEEEEEDTTFTMNPMTIEVDYQAFDYNQASQFVFTNPAYNYTVQTATTDDEWITIKDKTYEAGWGYLAIAVAANNSVERTGHVTVVMYDAASETTASATVAVVQAQNPNWATYGYIVLPDTVNVGSFSATSGSVTYDYSGIQAGRTNIAFEDDVNTWAWIDEEGTINWGITDNTSDTSRSFWIQLIGLNSSGNSVYSNKMYLYQEGVPEMGGFPIWKDYDYQIKRLGGDQYISYSLKDSIHGWEYNGRAYTPSNTVDIRISDIIKGHMQENLDLSNDGIKYCDGMINCILSVNGESKEIIYAWNDNSYDRQFSSQILSNPIRSIVDKRQKLLCSVVDHYGGGDSYLSRSRNGISNTFSVTDGIYTDVESMTNQDTTIQYVIGGNSIIYSAVCTDARYVVYYLNPYGGYDSFIFKGNCVRSDAYKSSQYTTYANNLLPDHLRRTYLRTDTPTWTLNTDYLTDEESRKMRWIAASTQVWLHDMVDDEIYPVDVKTNTYQTKTFKGNNRKFFTVSMQVELSQDRVQRA